MSEKNLNTEKPIQNQSKNNINSSTETKHILNKTAFLSDSRNISAQNIFHKMSYTAEKPIPSIYREIDNDLARDNLENDISAADLQDM